MKYTIALLMLFCISYSFVEAQYPRSQKIVGGEYFLDTDPGAGRGFWFSTDTIPDVEAVIPIPDPPINTRIYIRFKSSNGTWSGPRCIVRREYFSNRGATLVYGEYFINTDRGRGNGTPISIQPDGSINLNNLPLKRGDRVFLRLKDSFGRWFERSKSAAFNYKDICLAEYSVKPRAGVLSPWARLDLTAPADSSGVYRADKIGIAASHGDTVFVRAQTCDKFYSQSQRSTVLLPPAVMVTSTNSLSFGQVESGDTVERPVWIWNNSITPLLLTSASTSSPFFSTSLTLPDTVGGHDTLKFKVRFTGGNAGKLRDTLVIVSKNSTARIELWVLVTAIRDLTGVIPRENRLWQNFPNPFNPTTEFRFAIAESRLVTLKVYDVLGQEVATLVSEQKPPGNYAVTWDASQVVSGVYYYRLTAGSYTSVMKMLLLK